MSHHVPTPAVAATSTIQPTPFLKWAGGKTRLLEQYAGWIPQRYGRYFEPFIGGGAMYFHLEPEQAVISDVNVRLLDCYRMIRDQPEALIERLEDHQRRHSAEHYYQARKRINQGRGISALERAALMIYLNKTCFNGLYRENLRGEFNVPMGRYANPTIFRQDNLLAASRQLRGTEIRHASFEHVLESAEPGDFVYFDPPYVPLSATSSFTSYTGDGFSMALQQRLAEVFTELAHRGCHVLLSNSDCEAVRELYAGWHMVSIRAPRFINTRADRRGDVGEVLVVGIPDR